MKTKAEMYWHVHHDVLCEWCHDYDERRKYILEQKPQSEREIRLKLFQPVKGKLPTQLTKARKAYDEAWKAYDEAWKAREEARKAYDEAWKAHDEAWKAYDEAWKACEEAGKACHEAGKAYDEAWKACHEAYKACEEEIIALHQTECPNCPWNGKTIFT